MKKYIILILTLLIFTFQGNAFPWDLSTASYDSKSCYVGDKLANPHSLFFSADGAKFYIMGEADTLAYEYNVSTAWDVSTASYNAFENFSDISEDSYRGAFWHSDGLKFWTIGQDQDIVVQYTTSPAWDITQKIYSAGYDVTTQSDLPTALFFKSDGTKFFVLDSSFSEIIFQYSLGTPWSIATASYDSVSYTISEDSLAEGMFFNSDGTKMYVLGNENNSIFQYTLSTAWVVSSASYDSVSFSVGNEEGTPTTLYIKSDGTKFYILGTGNDTVYQYSMTPPSEGRRRIILGN